MAKYFTFLALFAGFSQAAGDPPSFYSIEPTNPAVIQRIVEDAIAEQDPKLSNDETLSCQFLLCMSAGSAVMPPKCISIMAKFTKKLIPKHPFDNPVKRMKKFLKLCPTGDGGATASYIFSCSGENLMGTLNISSDGVDTAVAEDVPDKCKEPLPGSGEESLSPSLQGLVPGGIEPYSVVLPVLVARWEIVCKEKHPSGGCKGGYHWLLHFQWVYLTDIGVGQSVIYDPNTGETFPDPPSPH